MERGTRTMRVSDLPEINKFSTPEKILLAEDLWDSIVSDESVAPVPRSHVEELDRRFERYEAAPGNLLTLEELRQRIEKGK
jgi:putative addiction module component (TIGR02574 family)